MLDELLSTEELGRVTFVRGHCFMGEGYCNADEYITTDESVPDGVPCWPEAPRSLANDCHRDYAWFLNVYSHNTNLLRYFLGGTPEVRYSHVASRDGGVVVFDFQGIPISLEVGRSSCRDWDEEIEIYFERGRLTIKTPPALLRNVPARVSLYRGDTHCVVEPQCEWRWSFRRQAEAFVRTVRDNVESLTSGVDSLEDLRLAETIWRMQEQRHPQPLCGGTT
jgi:predicted dehydrogenase